MEFLADLHIHSKYSRATSRNLDLENLDLWGKRKGLQVIGTGDFTHPGWLGELKEKLEPAEEGLYRLKESSLRELRDEYLPAAPREVRFLLTAEISSIYKKNDRTRKVHNVLFAPNLEAAEKIHTRLDQIGNVRSDGRPILGLDAKDLLAITLECDEEAFLVPAHIWTPHFSVLGAKSGFDTLEECFEDLTDRIFAVETGLSSDPPMNWRLKQLDRLTIISNSDAHSPGKLGREANLFDTDLSFPAIKAALADPASGGFKGTIEFFPEEGKYHFGGHRNCKQRLSAGETKASGGLCPVCGKAVTMGVMQRVDDLSDRRPGKRPTGRPGFFSQIPLQEVLGEIHGVGPNTKTVGKAYRECLETLGPELTILKDLPLERVPQPMLKEALRRMRKGEVQLQAGYDGEFGKISVFKKGEREKLLNRSQKTLF